MQQEPDSASSAPPCRLAAIDIGTNSIRLMVAEPLSGGHYRIIDEERYAARLGESLNRTGRIEPAAMERAVVALRHMKQIAEGHQAIRLRAIATCAAREAANGAELCRRAQEEAGLAIEVVSAQQEALFAFLSVQRAFDLADRPVAVIDIGGGSTEIVLAMGGMVEAIYPTELGAVRLAEMFVGRNLAGDGFKKLCSAIDRHLRKRVKRPLFVPHVLYGSGGTLTCLAAMLMAARGQANQSVRGYQVTYAEVRHLIERLRRLSPKERASVPGLSPDRADIIVPGLAIVDRVMNRLEVNALRVHNRGVRDGLLLTMLDELNGSSPVRPTDRQSSVEQLAARCGVEMIHASHVAGLAGQLFEELTPYFQLDPHDRHILEAAAKLQDVGYVIDYDQHHKHSYHLIVNSRLAGFSPTELELIANVARYHRGARPKAKHEPFRCLGRRDRRRVERLAAILRIAGALDRSHTQQVAALSVQRSNGETVIRALVRQAAEADIWDARRRTRLFERAFATRLTIDCQPVAGDLQQPSEDVLATVPAKAG